MHIELKNIDEIKPYEKNPRINDDAVEAVAKSIKEFGFRQPIVVDTDGVIIAGDTRLKAAKYLGLEQVPVHVPKELTPEQIKAFRIADNRTGEIAEWDYNLLPIELSELQEMNFDLSLLGFDATELDKLLNGDDEVTEGMTDPDEVPETPEEPISKRGEIYHLGNHRLMCGDSTDSVDVQALVCGEKADLLVQDPPYNVDYEGATPERLTIKNDNMEDGKFREFLTAAFRCAAGVMKPGASFYCFHADAEAYNFRGAHRDAGLPVHETLYWVKNAIVLSRLDYHYKSEPCQPAGTIIWTAGNGRKPIEELTDDEKVMSYDKSSGEILGYRHTGFSVKTASREYSGELYGIKVDDKITWTTPEHRFAVRFKTGSQNIWCTYLMKRGCLWRVGMCRIFNQLGYGLKIRLKQEKAEAAWILETHKGYKDASSAEHATAIKYGIPMTCWEPERGMLRKSERWRDKEHIEDIYLRLDLNEMEANAHRLLKDYHRLYEYPALTRAACGHKFSRRITTLVSACNLIPRIMELPIPYKHWDTPRCKTFDWETIDKVLHKEYEGLVYSLDVEKYHFYIADGIVTHNCLYGWKPGAAHRWFSDRCQSNIMEFNKPSRSEEHPSMKPVDMLIYLIKNSSSKDDIVVDLFGGSGSTLIAAEQTGRKAYLMELDEKYSDVIRKRWAEFVHGEGCAWEELTKPLTEVENE